MLSDEIKSFMHGDVATDDATLAKFSRDYSIFKVKPQIVVFPKDVDDVKNLVKFTAEKQVAFAAHGHGETISLTGRSAGTDMTGGPLTQSMPIECHLEGQLRFSELLKQVGDSIQELLEWQEYFHGDSVCG